MGRRAALPVCPLHRGWPVPALFALAIGGSAEPPCPGLRLWRRGGRAPIGLLGPVARRMNRHSAAKRLSPTQEYAPSRCARQRILPLPLAMRQYGMEHGVERERDITTSPTHAGVEPERRHKTAKGDALGRGRLSLPLRQER